MGTVKEEWRQISGAVPGYEVSNLGRVRHKNQKENFGEFGRDNGHGYLQTLIRFEDGSRKPQLVHRLVAKEFLDNPDSLPEVNHIDGDKSNNCFDNLEWTTRKGNAQHASMTGLKKCKFSKEEILYIRESNLFQRELAKMFNVNQYMISKIKRRISYAYY